MTKVIEKGFAIWTIGMGIGAVVGIIYGFVNVIIGNVISF
jgi:hypothetical protein